MNMFLMILGAICVALGVILIYDARPITKKYFGFGDQNEGSLDLKMFGFIFAFVGGILLMLFM